MRTQMRSSVQAAMVLCAGLLWLDVAVGLEAAVVQRCQICHQGDASLSARAPEELASQIAAVINAEVPHPAPPFPNLSPEDIRALAEALTN